jgi:hypothetical protein
MSTPTPKQGRRIALIVIPLVLVLAAGGIGIWIGSQQNQPAPPPTSDATIEPAPTDTEAPDLDPTGCLGGPNRDADMLLSAQAEAPQTTNGAVEVAAAFTRWIQRYPLPSSGEAELVGRDILADSSFTDDLPDYLSAGRDLSGGIVEAGQTYYMSTVPGVWHVESAEPSVAEVSVGTGFVIDGSLSPNLSSSITITLEWSDSGWRVADAGGERGTEELYSIGTAFTEGC